MTIAVAFGTSSPTSTTVVATSTSRSRRRTPHHRRPSSGGIFPRRTRAAGPRAGPPPVSVTSRTAIGAAVGPVAATRAESGSSGVVLLPGRVADPRAHDVRLVARRRPPRGPAARRSERAASPRGHDAAAIGDLLLQLAARRPLQVAVDRHRHGARDGRRRHHQQVRAPSATRRAGHRAARHRSGAARRPRRAGASANSDAVLDEGVRADDEPGLAGLASSSAFFFACRRQRTRRAASTRRRVRPRPAHRPGRAAQHGRSDP